MTRNGLATLLVVSFAAVFFGPEIFGDRISATANMARWRPWSAHASADELAAPSHNPDCNLSYYPRRVITQEAWRDGELPLWNPWAFGGTPFLADPQSGVFYPVNWFLLPMDPATQLGWFLFLHVVWAGVGIFFLTRFEGVGSRFAVILALAAVVNGYFVKHFGQPTFLATSSWVPWVLLASSALRRRPTRHRAVGLALAGAGMFLAGQPQVALHGAYAAAIVWFGRLLVERKPAADEWRAAAWGLGAGVLATTIVAAQLLPTVELSRLSARATLAYDTVISGAFHPVDVVRFLVPEFFGSPLTRDEWSPAFPRGDGFYLRNQLNSIFAGAPVFLLALFGMFCRRTWRPAFPYTLLFLLAVLIAFGTPLARLMYEVAPGFRFARIDRIGSLVVWAQFVPAALGVMVLAKSTARVGRFALGATWVAVAAIGIVLVRLNAAELPTILGATQLDVLADASVSNLVFRTQIALGAVAVAGVFLVLPGTWPLVAAVGVGVAHLVLFAGPYRGDRERSEFFETTPEIAELSNLLSEEPEGRFVRFGRDLPVRPWSLSSVLPPSTNVPYGLRDLQGYNALVSRTWGEALEAIWDEPVFSHGIWSGRRIVAPTREGALSHWMMDALAVRAVVSGAPIHAEGWTNHARRGFFLGENQEALPRIRLVARGEGVPRERVVDLWNGSFDPSASVFWVGEGRFGEPATEAGEVLVVKDGRNHIEVIVDSPTPQMLVVADADQVGWTATRDGVPAEILLVYGLVRGVQVPPGRHTISMEYRPPRFLVGTTLSLLGLLVAGVALAWPGRRDET